MAVLHLVLDALVASGKKWRKHLWVRSVPLFPSSGNTSRGLLYTVTIYLALRN
jgi:hypothetical protein